MAAASGDIAVGDPPPGKPGWRIGIASIDHPQEGLTRELLLHNQGISTSGDTEQYVEVNGRRYSHIVDPQTGIGLTNRTGVTIIAKNATISDGLATAVSVIGARKGSDLVRHWPGTAALIVEISAGGTNYCQSGKLPPATENKSH
jgi:thiamine biosynthesis lipoprotein